MELIHKNRYRDWETEREREEEKEKCIKEKEEEKSKDKENTQSNNARENTTQNTTIIVPKHYHTEISIPSLTDSTNIRVSNTANSYYGDELCVRIINTSTGTKVKFIGGTFEFGSGTSVMTLTASKRANIKFVFDGTKWVEVSRLVQ